MKHTASELDRICSSRVERGIFGCDGCEVKVECEAEAERILRERRK